VKGLVLVALVGCSARLGSDTGNHTTSDSGADAPGTAAADASPDARACTGGDAHASDTDGNCYLFFTVPKQYLEARAACAAISAHLVKITSAAQNAIVAQLSLASDSFIGASDLVTEGTFLWDDGTPLGFTSFHAGEPNNGAGLYQEDCLVMAGKRTPADTWDDRPCVTGEIVNAGSYAYTCEF
jgi:hypothetical protein